MAIRYAKNMCPIFREDGERIDIGSGYFDGVFGTLTASNLAGTLKFASTMAGSVSITLPAGLAQAGTATVVAGVTGIVIGDAVIVTPLTNALPEWAIFTGIRTDVTNKLTFEFFGTTGSAIGGVSQKFAWRKINV